MRTSGWRSGFDICGFFGRGGLWADQALGVLGVYPFFRVLRLAVPLLQRVTFADAQK